MKIAYLMQSDRPYEELLETLNQLTKQGDHVFIMINDNDLRDKIYFVFAQSKRIHISRVQEFAQEGDMSMPRGTLLQIKDALPVEDFDYFINLSDGMLPLKSRNELVDFLMNNKEDYFYVEADEFQDPTLRKRFERFYLFTSLLIFPTSKFTRSVTKGVASLLSLFRLKRNISDTLYIGSPYFMIKRSSAEILAKHFDYVSETFKLSWYAEEMYLPMMYHKFNIGEHVNKDYRILGSDVWKRDGQFTLLTQESIDKHPEALFGAKLFADQNLPLYEKYFDIYNSES